MSDTDYADLVLAEIAARREYDADPENDAKFLAWYEASDRKAQALAERQRQNLP